MQLKLLVEQLMEIQIAHKGSDEFEVIGDSGSFEFETISAEFNDDDKDADPVVILNLSS